MPLPRKLLSPVLLAVFAFAVAGCGQEPAAEVEPDGSGGVESTPELEAATDDYKGYVVDEAGQLVDETGTFTDAVIAGDVERAKETYAPARVHWERIEPIAASLGDLDLAIDAREGDVPEEEWTGFHRIEQALWEENTTEGQEEYARRLQADVEQVREQVEAAELRPEDLVTGSVELLNEVSAGKTRARKSATPTPTSTTSART